MSEAVLYKMSPFLSIQQGSGGDASLKVYNYLTGKSFQLGARAVEILRYFRQPKSPENAREQFEMDKMSYDSFFPAMLEARLLVTDDGQEEFVSVITLPKQTLFGLPAYTHNSSLPPSVIFTGVPFARGNDKSFGSAGYPDQLRSVCNYLQLNQNSASLFNFDSIGYARDFAVLKEHLSKNRLFDSGNIFFDFKETIDFGYEKISRVAGDLFRTGHIPFFLGGDHSITYPVVRAAVKELGPVSIIHIDAHSDTSYSKYDQVSHGKKTSHTHADFISHCLALPGVDKVYQFGLRGLGNRFVKETDRLKVYWTDQIRKQGAADIAATLDRSARYYVTVDIDVLDPVYAPGTGSLSAQGMTPAELTDLLYVLLPGLEIAGADLVEVDPSKDSGDITTQISCDLILHLLNLISVR